MKRLLALLLCLSLLLPVFAFAEDEEEDIDFNDLMEQEDVDVDDEGNIVDPDSDDFSEEALRELAAYYDGGEWRADFEDDEAGKLPNDLPRGVLTEDAIYDLLTDNRELLTEMLETAADITKWGIA